ncbi:MAG: T9SS type A sorting domain-containing protein [Flavobacteriales bacterium]|nr:T9SS type A sorting domain-containing protein [Flavobacteriales bacterium]
MMHRYLSICVLAFGLHASAQTIFIPDTNLRVWMNNAKPNSVDINGDCDTALWNAQPPQGVYCPVYNLPNNSTVDLQGIQHLKMDYLQISGATNDSIHVLWPGYPLLVEQIALERVNTGLFSPAMFPMPPSVQSFYCDRCGITQLPGFSGAWMVVKNTDLSGQVLNVPPSVISLDLVNCALSTSPAVPNVTNLTIDDNPLTSWANLPANLGNLTANNVGLSTPPPVAGSTTLTYLEIGNNGHTAIPALPPTLEYLHMDDNLLVTIPSLAGTTLRSLHVSNNPLTALPQLPATMEYLYAENTAITTLPNPLPPILKQLNVTGDQVTTIPPLPSTFQWLWIDNSQVSQLPAFPSSLLQLDALGATALTCLPALPAGMYRAKLAGSGVTCLPNIPPSFDITFNTLGIAPIVCNPGTSPCPIVDPLITGTTFSDADVDGVFDAGEAARPNATVIAQPGDLLTGSDINGNYVLPANVGSFSVTGVPGLYEPVTTAPYAVTFTALGQVDSLNHIGFNVIPGMYDLVTTITGTNVRPGFNTGVWLTVNNVGTEPTTATVQLTFDAALSYVSSSEVPDAVNGNVVDWTTPSIVPGGSWTVWVELYGPPALVLGTPVVQQATATPSQPDQTPADNTYILNDVVVGSFDPNDKKVEPSTLSLLDVTSGTRVQYTVRFQNTGTFPAERVLITDTLSSDLQWATMQVLGSSHTHTWYIHNGVLHVLFENINLPDSVSDEPGSHGFVKFSFVPSNALVTGDAVGNIANIYFDYNEPVITNEAVFYVETSLAVGDADADGLRAWPNPAQDVLFVALDGGTIGTLSVVDATGREVLTSAASGTRAILNVGGLAAGPYLLRCTNSTGVRTVHFLKH